MSVQLVPPLVGLVFFGVGVWLLASGLRFRRKAVLTRGLVVRLTSGTYGPQPVIEFQPVDRGADGKVRFRSSFGSTPSAYRVGDVVGVLYDPARPQRARVQSVFQRWIFPLIFLLVGLGMLLLTPWVR